MAEVEKIPIKETPDTMPESRIEASEQSGAIEVPKTSERPVEAVEMASPVSTPTPTTPAPFAKDETTKKVETVLEEGLGDTYKALTPDVQKKFRDEGEKVTGEIVGMMKSAKMKARKVLDLIRNWLKIIPHINKHFLDQEAKIKTDKVMHLSDKESQEIL